MSKRGPDFAAKLWHVAAPELVIEPATEDSWARLERMLGVKLPANLRSVLKRFGTGIFGGRLLKLNPSAEQDWRSEFSACWVHGVSGLLGRAFRQLSFDAAKGGLIPIGMTADIYLPLPRAIERAIVQVDVAHSAPCMMPTSHLPNCSSDWPQERGAWRLR
ncbi:MAG: hypothetical protein ACI8T1_001557 [Verrucomicrobiales bacterium]